MKKFYSALALAAAVTVSATAADVKKVSMQKAAALDAQMVELQAEKPAKAPQKASTPAPSNIEELQGIYTYTCYANFFDGYDGPQTRELAILPGSDADHIKIIGLANIAIEASVNYGGGLITFEGQYACGAQRFSDGTFDCFLTHYRFNDNGKGIYEDKDNRFAWVMYEDGEIECDDTYDIFMYEVGPGNGYMPGYCGYGYKLKKQVEPTGVDWETIGQASFVDDGYFLPNWDFDGDPVITCDLQRDKNNPAHLRLYNAYGNLNQDVNAWLGVTSPADPNYYAFNEENLPGSIQLNADFPYCVAVPAGYIGAVNGGLWFGSNMEASSLEGTSDPEAQAQALLNALGADKLSMIDYEGKIAVIRNCQVSNVLLGSGYTSWSTWASQHNIKDFDCSDTVTIMLPEDITEPSALGTITADENAPVEYFNLQGIRIDNPESGLYIRRQGNTVTKIVR